MRNTRVSIHPALLVFFALIIFLFLATRVCAAAEQNVEATQQTNEAKFIQNLANNAMAVVVDTSLAPRQLNTKYHEILSSSFDTQAMGEYILGRAWVQITPKQKQEYLKLLKEFIVTNYGSRLRPYKGEAFKVSDAYQSGGNFITRTEITHTDGSPSTLVDWVIRRDKLGKLAIIDVVIDGVSQSNSHRDEFASILGKNGGNIKSLLNVLRMKIQQSSKGSN